MLLTITGTWELLFLEGEGGGLNEHIMLHHFHA